MKNIRKIHLLWSTTQKREGRRQHHSRQGKQYFPKEEAAPHPQDRSTNAKKKVEKQHDP